VNDAYCMDSTCIRTAKLLSQGYGLASSRHVGVVAVWVLRVGGPESFPILAVSMAVALRRS
jgi:hypothetical protein